VQHGFGRKKTENENTKISFLSGFIFLMSFWRKKKQQITQKENKTYKTAPQR
jgi:hypothetical protein